MLRIFVKHLYTPLLIVQYYNVQQKLFSILLHVKYLLRFCSTLKELFCLFFLLFSFFLILVFVLNFFNVSFGLQWVFLKFYFHFIFIFHFVFVFDFFFLIYYYSFNIFSYFYLFYFYVHLFNFSLWQLWFTIILTCNEDRFSNRKKSCLSLR